MREIVFIVAIALSLGSLSLIAPCQTTSAQRDMPPLTVKVSVLVIDSSGQPVKNLQQSSFHLSEEGKNQTITSYSTEELPLRFGLVVDNTGSTRPFSDKVREAARLIIANMKLADKAFLMS